MEAEVAAFSIKKHIYEQFGLDTVAHTQTLMSCFARKFHCQPNSLCNQRNYPKEIEHC